MDQADTQCRQRDFQLAADLAGGLGFHGFGFLDQGAHPIRLLPRLTVGQHALNQLWTSTLRHGYRLDGLPPGR